MGVVAKKHLDTAQAVLRGRILLVDDQVSSRTGYTQVLHSAGYDVQTAPDGHHAIALLKGQHFNVVVSDISLPNMGGMDVLRAVRASDLDVPVILMSESPTVDKAMLALEYGALRYLIKPVSPQELIQMVGQAVLLHQIAQAKREALRLWGDNRMQMGDRASADACFTRALDTLWMAFQPIVDYRNKRLFGFEALVRTKEPTIPHPGALFDVAERLGRLQELSQVIRQVTAQALLHRPADAYIFVNLHARDLLDEKLYEPAAPLSAFAQHLVFEITERVALDEIGDVHARIAALRRLGYRIAIDDLGAGYAGLTAFAQLEPDVVKLDMSLVRDCRQERHQANFDPHHGDLVPRATHAGHRRRYRTTRRTRHAARAGGGLDARLFLRQASATVCQRDLVARHRLAGLSVRCEHTPRRRMSFIRWRAPPRLPPGALAPGSPVRKLAHQRR